MRRDSLRESRVLEPSLHHATHVNRGHRLLGKLLGATHGAPKKRAGGRFLGQLGSLPVREEKPFEVVPDRNLSGLALLLVESQAPLVPVVLEVLELQLGDCSDRGSSIYKDTNDGPVPQTAHGREVYLF